MCDYEVRLASYPCTNYTGVGHKAQLYVYYEIEVPAGTAWNRCKPLILIHGRTRDFEQKDESGLIPNETRSSPAALDLLF